jgi:hypothetical protein
MNCVICTNPFVEGDKKTESPSCGCIGHTSCAFRLLSGYVLGYSSEPLNCPSCRTQIYRHIWLDQRDADTKSAQTRIATLKENSEFNKDLHSIKKKLRLRRRAITNFKKYLAPKKAQFKNEIKSHIDLIKSYHKRYVDAAKKEPLYKVANSFNASYRLSLTRFITKYDLSDDAVKILKCESMYRGRRYYWNNSPSCCIKRTIRLRLYL